jgi:hypothetical protein
MPCRISIKALLATMASSSADMRLTNLGRSGSKWGLGGKIQGKPWMLLVKYVKIYR